MRYINNIIFANQYLGMKYLICFFCLSILLFSACENDFELTEGKVNIPIVYGILSPTDTAHYIRLERAFSDPKKPASEIALIPDSLYYSNADVRLYRTRGNLEVSLDKVDGNLEGFIRNEGSFAQSPNILYKVKQSEIGIQPGDIVELRITLEEGQQVSSKTVIVEPPFPQTPNYSTGSLNFEYTLNNNYSFNPGANSAVHSVIMHIKILEIFSDGTSITKVLPWTIAQNIDTRRVQVLGRDFYQFLRSNLETDPQIKRFFQSIDFEIISGTQEIYDYVRVLQANLGITSSGEIPVYSNMSTGYGIFASRASTIINNLPISATTQDSLKKGFITKDLNFQ